MPELQLVLADFSETPAVDIAGADMLTRLHEDLARRGVALRVVEAHARVRDLLRAAGLQEQVGAIDRHLSLDRALVDWQEAER